MMKNKKMITSALALALSASFITSAYASDLDINTINDSGIIANADDSEAIKKKKQELIERVEASEWLTDGDKASYKTRINLASSLATLEDLEKGIPITEERRRQEKENPQPEEPTKSFAEQKQELKDQIDASPLSKTQKEALKKRVDRVSSEIQAFTLMSIMQDFQTQAMQAGQKVEQDKASMLADIEASNLTDAQKEELKKKVEAVKDVDASAALIKEVADEIEKGPTEDSTEPIKEVKTEVVEEEVDFVEVKEDDSTLEKGQTKVEKEGEKGLDKVTYEVTYEDGKEVSREEKSRERIKDPVNRVIKVGTKEETPSSSDLESKKQELMQKVMDAANDGKIDLVKVGDLVARIQEADNEDALKAIEEEINTIVNQDPEVLAKKRQVLQKLQNANISSDKEADAKDLMNRINAATTIEELEKLDQEVDALIGPKTVTRYITEDIEVPYDTEKVNDPDLEEGQKKLKSQGVKGLIRVTYKVTEVDGEIVEKEEVSKETITEKKDEVVLVGTKKKDDTIAPVETTKEEKVRIDVDFEKKTENDPTLEVGKEVVIPGIKGITEITYEVTYRDGEEVSRKEKSREVITAPVDEVTKIGTKPIETPTVPEILTKEETKIEVIKFETKYENDPTLEVGKTKVKQEGQNGLKEVVYTVTYEDGVEKSRVVKSEKITSPVVYKIIVKGTKQPVLIPETITKTRVETYPIAFDTIYVEDDTLDLGKEIVSVVGQNGVREVVYTDTIKDNKVVSTTKVSEKVTKLPINRVVRRGTRKLVTIPQFTWPTYRDYPRYEYPTWTYRTDAYTPTTSANTNSITAVGTKSEIINVPAGYKYIKPGTYTRVEIEDKLNRLEVARRENKVKVEAVKFLLEYTPNTVRNVKAELNILMAKSEILTSNADSAIAELEAILAK